MKEIIFNSPEQYLSYDFDDNYCFFFIEIKAVLESIEKIDIHLVLNFDPGKELCTIVQNLFLIYDSLIIVPDEEKLFGTKDGAKFLIKESEKAA